MPKSSGAPTVGDLVVVNPRDVTSPPHLVIETRGIELLVLSPSGWAQWVRRAGVEIVNESR